MSFLLLLLALSPAPPPEDGRLWRQVLEALEQSGRLTEVVPVAPDRLATPRLAPGAPPLLTFRYFEGRQRHRLSELGLVMDDAGH
jgi:hypothetical protein